MAELRRTAKGVLQRRATPTRAFGKAKRALFLDELAATCNVEAAARAAGIWAKTAQSLRKRDGAFARLWAEAIDQGRAHLEEELLAHALGHGGGGDNPDDERSGVRRAAFDPDLALKVLQLRARPAPGGQQRAAAPAPSQAEVDASLMKRLQDAASRIGRR